MPERVEKYKNNHLNTLIFLTLVGHSTRTGPDLDSKWPRPNNI